MKRTGRRKDRNERPRTGPERGPAGGQRPLRSVPRGRIGVRRRRHRRDDGLDPGDELRLRRAHEQRVPHLGKQRRSGDPIEQRPHPLRRDRSEFPTLTSDGLAPSLNHNLRHSTPKPSSRCWRIHRTSPCGIRPDSLRAPIIARIDDRRGAEVVARANRAINALSALQSTKHRSSLRRKPVLVRTAAPTPSTSTRSALFTRNAPRNQKSVTHAG